MDLQYFVSLLHPLHEDDALFLIISRPVPTYSKDSLSQRKLFIYASLVVSDYCAPSQEDVLKAENAGTMPLRTEPD